MVFDVCDLLTLQRVAQSAAVGIIFGFWLGCALGEH